jgi:ubiquinone/menaquinone biosynthesis C-methylase UbiE
MTTEQYTHGHHRSVVAAHSARRASESAAFLLPRLKSPMRLLDFGCGPGTITVDLAGLLAPGGSALGIDYSEEVIEQARKHAAASGTKNVQFEARSIYDTGLEGSSFDVAYAHQVLQHLSEPVKALTEVRRVLKPGGICAVREVDWGSSALSSDDPRLGRFFEVYYAVARHNGGDPEAGRHLKRWFEEAGFHNLEVTTSTWTFAERSGIEWWGKQWAERILHSNIATSAIEYGVADEAELKDISQAWLDWIESPGAFYSFIHVEVIGKKD